MQKKFILHCSKLCDYSYLNLSQFNKKIKINRKKYDLKLIDEKGCQAYIMDDEKSTYIILKGTSEFEDVKTNLKFFNEKDKLIKAKIHEGFKEYADYVFPQIKKHVKEITKNKNLYLIGHSLGGSLAKIISLRLYKDSTCVTFGEPKVFKSIPFQDFNFDKKYIRVVNSKDLITKIPNFYHHGKLKNEEIYYLDRNNKLIINPSKMQLNYDMMKKLSCDLMTLKFFFGFFIKSTLENHKIENYYKILKKNIN